MFSKMSSVREVLLSFLSNEGLNNDFHIKVHQIQLCRLKMKTKRCKVITLVYMFEICTGVILLRDPLVLEKIFQFFDVDVYFDAKLSGLLLPVISTEKKSWRGRCQI